MKVCIIGGGAAGLMAAISAALAETLGTHVNSIRIHSIRQL